jgi:hypothetical protein
MINSNAYYYSDDQTPHDQVESALTDILANQAETTTDEIIDWCNSFDLGLSAYTIKLELSRIKWIGIDDDGTIYSHGAIDEWVNTLKDSI